MRFKTHLAGGFACYLFLLHYYSIPTGWLFFGLFILLSIVPDIDLYSSWIGKRVPVLSHLFTVVLGHRGVLHSLWPMIGLAFLLVPFGYGFALFGYGVHLLLDASTRKGIFLLWPYWRVTGSFDTGKIGDTLFFFVFVGWSLYFAFILTY
ncbi:MAG: metal-dependent hydrolase [Candidatus Woesearchaeota archaeon]